MKRRYIYEPSNSQTPTEVKTKSTVETFIEGELIRFDNLYWKNSDILKKKKKEIETLQHEISSLERYDAEYDAERKKFQTMLDELNNTEK
jgi:hypothetical protein